MSKAFITKPAPAFSKTALMPNREFKTISLDDFKGNEIWGFSDRVEEFKSRGAEVIGASVDSEFSHLQWTKMDRKQGGLGDMKIPLISDINKQLSRDYGVLLEQDGVALRGTFIIDPQGVLRQVTINDLPVGRSVDETLRLLDAFIFVEENNGEAVCPLNWKKGGSTINPDPNKSLEFFSKQG